LADFVIVTTRAGKFDLGVGIARAKWLDEVGADWGIIHTHIPAKRGSVGSPLVRAAREELKRQEFHRVWNGQLTHRHSVPIATAHGRSVFEADLGGRRSRGSTLASSLASGFRTIKSKRRWQS
jgi:hypothetical protein